MNRDPIGFTLLELVVALALLGMIAALSAVALTSLEDSRSSAGRAEWEARAAAIRSGTPVTHDTVRFLPDGRVVVERTPDAP